MLPHFLQSPIGSSKPLTSVCLRLSVRKSSAAGVARWRRWHPDNAGVLIYAFPSIPARIPSLFLRCRQLSGMSEDPAGIQPPFLHIWSRAGVTACLEREPARQQGLIWEGWHNHAGASARARLWRGTGLTVIVACGVPHSSSYSLTKMSVSFTVFRTVFSFKLCGPPPTIFVVVIYVLLIDKKIIEF